MHNTMMKLNDIDQLDVLAGILPAGCIHLVTYLSDIHVWWSAYAIYRVAEGQSGLPGRPATSACQAGP